MSNRMTADILDTFKESMKCCFVLINLLLLFYQLIWIKNYFKFVYFNICLELDFLILTKFKNNIVPSQFPLWFITWYL